MQEFRTFLTDGKFPYTEKDLLENNEWVRSSIKSELFVGAFGQQEGMRVQAEADPNVLKALDLMPKAKDLADNARKTIAEHNQARLAATCNYQGKFCGNERAPCGRPFPWPLSDPAGLYRYR